MKNKKNLIGVIIAVVLLVIFLNPEKIPLSEKTMSAMKELRDTHLLMQGLIHYLSMLLFPMVLHLYYLVKNTFLYLL